MPGGSARAATLSTVREMELRIVRHTTRFDAACRFYGDVLGWPVTREWPAGDGQGRGRIFGYGDTARVEFAAAGVPILRGLADQPWGHRNLAVHDPTGLEVVFFQPL